MPNVVLIVLTTKFIFNYFLGGFSGPPLNKKFVLPERLELSHLSIPVPKTGASTISPQEH